MTDSSQTQSLDCLFARLGGEGTRTLATPVPIGGGFVAPHVPYDPQGPAELPLAAPIPPPPALENPADLRAASDWLQTERSRLDEYTHQQFAWIQQQHQALVAKVLRSEEAMALRTQEVNREMRFLASRTETLQSRARDLANRELALAAQMERLSRAQAEYLAIQQTSKNVQKDTEAQRTLLEQMQAETARLREEEALAHNQFTTFETELKERQQTWEKKQAEMAERQAQMEQRYSALEKAEEAARQRMTELDELEDRLRQELEMQDRQLAIERRDLHLLRTKLCHAGWKQEALLDG